MVRIGNVDVVVQCCDGEHRVQVDRVYGLRQCDRVDANADCGGGVVIPRGGKKRDRRRNATKRGAPTPRCTLCLICTHTEKYAMFDLFPHLLT
jgi:hypothetical protein